jgi:putative heme-binding domain-containing protein
MPNSSLQAHQLTPFLNSNQPDLKQTALWVASHHPEWAGEMVSFLEKRFSGAALTSEEKQLFGDMLTSYCSEPGMQEFMAQQVKAGSPAQKVFLMDAMAKCDIKNLPESWLQQIGNQLTQKNEPVQLKAIELIKLRKIKSLASPLTQTAEDDKNATGVRLEALAILLESQPVVSDKQFDFLYQQLNQKNEAPLRQQAAAVLAQGKLAEEQLIKIATDYLPQADPFILPRLVPLFQGAHNSQIGKALASTLLNSPSLDSYNEENIKAVFAQYPNEVKPAVEQLITKLRNAQAGRLEKLKAMESQIGQGDLERGRKLYFGKAVCASCHTVGADGGKLGPDLTSIQRDRSAHDLLEAIVYPSASFVREFETYRVKTKTNDYTGIIKEKNPDAILLATSPQTSVRILRPEIVSMQIVDVSLMPQGLDKLLTDQEMADLMAFIIGQDQDPEKDRSILR